MKQWQKINEQWIIKESQDNYMDNLLYVAKKSSDGKLTKPAHGWNGYKQQDSEKALADYGSDHVLVRLKLEEV